MLVDIADALHAETLTGTTGKSQVETFEIVVCCQSGTRQVRIGGGDAIFGTGAIRVVVPDFLRQRPALAVERGKVDVVLGAAAVAGGESDVQIAADADAVIYHRRHTFGDLPVEFDFVGPTAIAEQGSRACTPDGLSRPPRGGHSRTPIVIILVVADGLDGRVVRPFVDGVDAVRQPAPVDGECGEVEGCVSIEGRIAGGLVDESGHRSSVGVLVPTEIGDVHPGCVRG